MIKYENGILSAEHLVGFLRKEMEKAEQRKQLKDTEKLRRDQASEETRTHARMLFAEGFVSLGYDTEDHSIVSMVETLASSYVRIKTKSPNAEDKDIANTALVEVWHMVGRDWRPILDKLKAYFKEGKKEVETEEA